MESNACVRVWGEGERVLLIHGSMVSNPESVWEQQRDLAERYQLIIPHRRGYGQNFKTEQLRGYENNVQDIIALLTQPTHIVGHSYGGLLALVAAARRPTLIKSLTVIEPPALGLARTHHIVTELIEALQQVYHTSLTPEAFLTHFMKALNMPAPTNPLKLSPQYRRGIVATMTEAEPWNIPIPLETLATYPFPKLVVAGNWNPALSITADILVRGLEPNQQLLIKGIDHALQRSGKLFNAQLEALIASAM